MIRHFNIDFDGIDGDDHWEDYTVDDDLVTEDVMFEDVRFALKALNGGRADVWVADSDDDILWAVIEV